MAKKDDWDVVDLDEQDVSLQEDAEYDEDYRGNGFSQEELGEEDYDGGGYRGEEDQGSDDRGKRGVNRKGNGARGKGPGKKGRTIGSVLIVVGVLCLIAGVGVLAKNRMDAKRVQDQMEVLRNQVDLDASRQAAEEASRQAEEEARQAASGENGETQQGDGAQTAQGDETSEGESASEEVVRVPNPYADSFRQNSDMAAWLKIEGTKIDYPVMQTMEDENYYLKRGFDKKDNQNGCLILDTDSTITGDLSTNQIIHGHNMKSGEMFGTLTKYEDQKYCEEHKYITLYTGECERKYEVIAVFRSQVYKKTDDVFKFYKFFQADTQEEFDNWYSNIKELSEFDTGVTAQFGDRFLTLSTCVYHVENGRLAVVAKEIETGDYYEPVE